jgi:GTPase SAR1 family protein
MNIPLPEKCDYIVKIAVFGGKQTGKTNILSRMCYNDFTGSYKETIGIDFFVTTMNLG